MGTSSMKVTMYGGPYDGSTYEVSELVPYLVVPLGEPSSYLTDDLLEKIHPDQTIRVANVPIKRSIKFGRIADWQARTEHE